MIISVHAIKTSVRFLNQKLSQKAVPGLLKLQHDQKIPFYYYHLQLEYYPLYVYFVMKEGNKLEVYGKNLEKKQHETETKKLKTKMLNDESIILRIGYYNFGEGPNSVVKEVHYHHECKRNHLHKKDKSSNIK